MNSTSTDHRTSNDQNPLPGIHLHRTSRRAQLARVRTKMPFYRQPWVIFLGFVVVIGVVFALAT